MYGVRQIPRCRKMMSRASVTSQNLFSASFLAASSCVWKRSGWYFSASFRYACRTSSSVAASVMPSVRYASSSVTSTYGCHVCLSLCPPKASFAVLCLYVKCTVGRIMVSRYEPSMKPKKSPQPLPTRQPMMAKIILKLSRHDMVSEEPEESE